MYPILFKVGPITAYSYGFFLALAFAAATYIIWREGKKQGFQEEKLMDFSIANLLAAVIGGRIYYAIINFHLFASDLRTILYFWEGGFAFYGSAIAVALVSIFLLRRWRWSILAIADIGALAIMAATILAKIGSFLAGNDYGSLTRLPWGVVLVNLEGKRHPVQLYEALFTLILFIVLYRFYKKRLKEPSTYRAGETFLYFLFWSSVGRFIFEFFRGDSTYLLGVKLGNIASFLLAVLAGFSLYFYQFRDFSADRAKAGKYGFGLGRFRKRRNNEYRDF
ncbi:MAG TPA: prolipoprotein diacylglyceryl transferase [Candidatus Saccharimonadales bacterium]|nr:prolipoprotein diacylglyceryl transferase [Candidatus Saccharimonadales bacterium]